MALKESFPPEMMSLDEAIDLVLARAAGATVLAVGDVMLDRFIHGRVDRISPEAPIPVLKVEREIRMPGGVGNVVANLRSLGGRAVIVALVGADAEGRLLAELLDPGEGRGLVVDAGRPTIVKDRFVAGGQQLLRADFEDATPLSEPIGEALQAALIAQSDQASALVLSDYGKGVLSPGLVARAIAIAGERGIPVVVDPKGADYRRYRGADVVTPNLKELAEAAGGPATGDAAIVSAARRVMGDCGLRAMVVTRGGEGLSVVPADGEAAHIRAEAREVFDVSGAGDTVVATLALALAAGARLEMAARMANLAGGVVVGKIGTAAVTAEELRHAADARDGGVGDALSLGRLLGRVERWRRRGLKVGFTNGCFDILHPGHVSLLRQARAACDRLVVGLNSDQSVRRLKGPTRPVSNEMARAAVLASLADVDAVTVFGEDTPAELIAAVRPDVLVKGADYEMKDIVGADFVRSYGGRVVRARLEAGHSTTRVIAQMKG